MIVVTYVAAFLKELAGMPLALQDEAKEKIVQFSNPNNHKVLRVHKLKGRLAGKYSFSVNYRYRIVFQYIGDKNTVELLMIGDHDIYN